MRLYRPLYRIANQRSGFTLIELMVTIAVISVLAAIALPAVKNSLREQKVTRAASLVQSAIEEGRARSIGSGGGGGIIIDRVGSSNVQQLCESFRIRFAAGAPAYTGDSGLSRCLVAVIENTPTNVADDEVALWFPPGAAQLQRSMLDIAAGSVPTLINQGDLIQLGDAGLPLRIASITAGSALFVTNDGVTLPVTVPPSTPTDWIRVMAIRPERNLNLRRFAGTQVPFAISKSPRPAIAASVSLVKGTSIDLTSSGMGRDGIEFSPFWIEGNYVDTTIQPFLGGGRDYRSVWILFGARGEVSQVLVGDNSTPPVLESLQVTGDIHLLVGRSGNVRTDPREQLEDDDSDPLADEATDGKTPLLDSESIWVTIKARTGEVLSSPWTDPTDDATFLIPGHGTTPAVNAQQQARIQTVVGRTRTAAVTSRDQGSL